MVDLPDKSRDDAICSLFHIFINVGLGEGSALPVGVPVRGLPPLRQQAG